jgi:hypothetical protein
MKKFLLFLILLIPSFGGFAQNPEAPEQREERLREEIRLLEAQIKYMNTIKSASGSSNITAATAGGSTTFASAQQANLETVSLSYEALEEISQTIDRALTPTVSGYRGLVIYYEPDFLALTRYRLYREQVRLALANYEAIVKRIEDEGTNAGVGGASRPKSVRMLGAAELVTALSAPSIATSAIKSVAELASLFRIDTTITESRDVVDRDSLGTVVAGTFMKANPNLAIYHPGQFVAEYELGINDPNSLYSQTSRVNAAEAYLNYFLDEAEKLPKPERETPPLNRIIAAAKVVQTQIRNLGFSPGPSERAGVGVNGGGGDNPQAKVSEFRQMLRAEKLERVLNPAGGGKVGVLKLRLLSSGGARRDKKNLIMGGKTDYSGSAVVEVALYDADGTMRASQVFTHHTGFRKFRTGEKPRL